MQHNCGQSVGAVPPTIKRPCTPPPPPFFFFFNREMYFLSHICVFVCKTFNINIFGILSSVKESVNIFFIFVSSLDRQQVFTVSSFPTQSHVTATIWKQTCKNCQEERGKKYCLPIFSPIFAMFPMFCHRAFTFNISFSVCNSILFYSFPKRQILASPKLRVCR